MNSNSDILLQKLNELVVKCGFVVFTIGDFYVQFSKDNPDEQIVFEAVSKNFVPSVKDGLDDAFATMDFVIEAENYYKTVNPLNFGATISEVARIFSQLYEVDYTQPFSVREDIY